MNITQNKLLNTIKYIQIPIHGSVPISLMAKYFIDNRYFQRLTKLKQLGTCDYIFPGAKHTRFEHSIGTYYLSTKILDRIKTNSDNFILHNWLSSIPELETHYHANTFGIGLNNWIIELVNIAALCHDIGHGPYSHVFDDIFIKKSEFKTHPMATHEVRSCVIIEHIVNESPILSKYISTNDIKFIQSIINPESHRKGFIYQIVSNNLNGLDVDKYDYICRDTLHTSIKNGFDHMRMIDSILVIDNNIVYPEQSEHDIYNLFITRHSLHRRIYNHKSVISAQHIITDIMYIIDKVIDISNSITNIDIFLKMTDEYILQYMEFILDMKDKKIFNTILTDTDYKNLNDLRIRLQNHNMYPHIGTVVTREPFDVDEYFNNDTFIIFQHKVGFVSGDKTNPLDNIYVYKTKELFMNGSNIQARKINKNDISHIIPDIYQEYITMIFYKGSDINVISNGKFIFQRITDMLNE